MSRKRVNAAAVVPETGPARSSANVIVTWDPATPLADVEESIKAAARAAVQRARVVARIDGRPAPAVAGQLTLPGT